MKIGFSGSQGTGKTTLAKAMLNDPEFRDFTYVPSAAREAVANGFKVNKEAQPLDQLVTTVGRISSDHDLAGVRSVSDRTPIDSLAYTKYQMQEVWNFDNPYYWKVSYDLVRMGMQEYDHVFYFPPYWAPQPDGVRSGDTMYQLQIDDYVLYLLDEMKINYFTVPDGTNKERIDFVRRCIAL